VVGAADVADGGAGHSERLGQIVWCLGHHTLTRSPGLPDHSVNLRRGWYGPQIGARVYA